MSGLLLDVSQKQEPRPGHPASAWCAHSSIRLLREPQARTMRLTQEGERRRFPPHDTETHP